MTKKSYNFKQNFYNKHFSYIAYVFDITTNTV